MIKILLAFLLAGLPVVAQTTAADVAFTITATITNPSLIATITASQGSGTVCTVNKLPAATPLALITCIGGDGKALARPTFILANGSVAVNTGFFAFNDVYILWALNATTAAVTLGSLGSVPANNLAIQYTTGVKAGGSTAPQTVITAWP